MIANKKVKNIDNGGNIKWQRKNDDNVKWIIITADAKDLDANFLKCDNNEVKYSNNDATNLKHM